MRTETAPTDNLGRRVKWQDPEDAGWHTGRLVTYPAPYDGVNAQGINWHASSPINDFVTLVKESCDGRLTWVLGKLLQDWPLRSEWEDDNEGGRQAAEREEDDKLIQLTLDSIRYKHRLPTEEEKAALGLRALWPQAIKLEPLKVPSPAISPESFKRMVELGRARSAPNPRPSNEPGTEKDTPG